MFQLSTLRKVEYEWKDLLQSFEPLNFILEVLIVFVMKDIEFYQMLFSESVILIIWFFFSLQSGDYI